MDMTPSQIPTQELIQKVYLHPSLWDRTCAHYRDKCKKEKAWLEICADLQPNFDQMKATLKRELLLKVTKKWYNVRDSYRKYLKNKSKEKKEYLHANILSFMDPNYANIEGDTFDEVTFGNDSNDNNSEHYENEVYLDFEEANVEPAAKRLRMESQKKDADENNIINILASLIQKEDDEDRAFFKSITPAVKKLSDESRLEFRIEVMKSLKNLRKKDKQGLTLKVEEATDSEGDG